MSSDWPLRLLNRKDFIAKTNHSQIGAKRRFAALTICFNSVENTRKLVDFLDNEEKRSMWDLVIIDNCTDVEQHEKLRETYQKNDWIRIIKTTTNTGSAWWYAIGMEYCIDQEYEYICLIEDDILLDQNWAFSELCTVMKPSSVGFIEACTNTGWPHSRYVQFACYPKAFLIEAWVIDPRYFFRWEDLEWAKRIEKTISKKHYKKAILPFFYAHPYLKKLNWSVWWIYFSIRNQLFTFKKYGIFADYPFLFSLFLYLRYGCTKILIENDYAILKVVLTAVSDGIFAKPTLDLSHKRLQQFKKTQAKLPKEMKLEIVHKKDLDLLTKNLYLPFRTSFFSEVDVHELKFSRSVKNFFTNGTLIWWRFSPLYPFFILASTIVSLEEYDLPWKSRFSLSILKPNPFRFQLIGSVIWLLLSLLFATIIFPVLILVWILRLGI